MFSSRTLKKVSKNAGKTIVTIIVVLYLTVNVLFRSQNNNQPILVSDKSYWDALDQVGVDGKFYTKLLPYNVIPVTEEVLRQESTAWWSPVVRGPTRRTKLLHERRGEAFGTPVLIQEALFQSEIHYLRRLPPEEMVRRGSRQSSWRPSLDRLDAPRDYFRYLHTPQSWCRKLVMLGGMLPCSNANVSMPEDGNKIVCLDPPLELPAGGRDPRSCLVFSFGINDDTTFDDAVSRLPCEVHMFDLKPVDPVYLMGLARHVHFHEAGLADHHFISYVQDVNKTLEFNDVAGFLRDKELTGRPLHVLKIDIEESEWDILKQLVKEPILDIVGQIAMEVHVMKVLELPPSERLNFLRDRYQILREIEKRGFRAVSYWDNRQPKLVYRDPDGSSYDTCGEILYVNTNWYKDSFKRKLKDIGFKFRGV